MSSSTPRALGGGGAAHHTATSTTLRDIHLNNLAESHAASNIKIKVPFSLRPSTWIKRLIARARRNLGLAIVVWWLSFFSDVVFASLLSPSSIFDDPLDFVASLVIYTVVGVGLTVYAGFLTLFNAAGGQKWLGEVANKWAQGTTLPNWFNPEVVGQNTVQGAVNQARRLLAGGIPTTRPPTTQTDENNPAFTSNSTASDVFYNAKRQFDAGAIDKDVFEAQKVAAEELLAASERKIRAMADHCNLEFDGVSDLITVGGSVASIFFTRPGANEDPFIILVIKGK
ncbi:hypothetical protein JCM6882_001619 [Rhodosporidiobolus microsporus]